MLSSSVVMATYNGEHYVAEQIKSVLSNLSEKDELIISDDGSTDNTITIIREFMKIDPRVRLIQGPRKGVVKNFECGLRAASKEIVYLSDQDDIWLTDKIKTINEIFEKDQEITCILHDVKIVNEKLVELSPSFFRYRGTKLGLINNIIKNSYMGSAMAFRRSIIRYALPIPEHVPMHDQWIGLISEAKGRSYKLEIILGLYRRHSMNVSHLGRGRIIEMIPKRLYLILCLAGRLLNK